jgi:catechol 2,3-dioxygenase-like lactoylglutathione lyase family enzyme
MSATPSIRSKSLHHVAYATRDPEATFEFYSGKLGMPLVHTENHLQGEGYFRHFFFEIGPGEYLAFFAVKDVGEKPDYHTQVSLAAGLPVWVNHLAFRLDDLEELAAMKQRMLGAGLELYEIDHGWVQSLYTLDPNGIMVEFAVTTDAVAFGQSEAEALRLLRLPPERFDEATRKEHSVARKIRG